MRGLSFSGSKQHEATPEEFEEHRRRTVEEVADLCGGEEVLGAAHFRQGGARAQDMASEIGDRLGGLGVGFLAKKGAALARKKVAGGLPKSTLLAVTPSRLIAFDTSYRISTRRSERENGRPTEVASWDRAAVGIELGSSGPMTTLRIEPLDGGAVATLVGGSNVDDPWSLAVMNLLAQTPSPAAVR